MRTKGIWSTLILSVLAAFAFAYYRQNRIDESERVWEDLGGGIGVSEVPLLGPATVFITLPQHLQSSEIKNMHNAVDLLYKSCNPELDIRWSFNSESTVPGQDAQLKQLEGVLGNTRVSKIYFRQLDCSDESLFELIEKLQSVQRVRVSRRHITPEDLASINKRLDKAVLSY